MRLSKLRASGRLRRYGVFFSIVLLAFFSLNLILRLLLPALSIDPTRLLDNMMGGLQLMLMHAASELEDLFRLDVESCMVILKKGLPFLGKEEVEVRGDARQEFFKGFLSVLTGVELTHPRAVIRAEIPYVISARETTVVLSRNQLSRRETSPSYYLPGPPVDSRPDGGIDKLLGREPEKRGWGDNPLVAIYHTHTTESYESMSRVTHTRGVVGDIVKVGEEVTRTLTDKYGIPVRHSKRINDYPNWSQAYVNSQMDISRIVRENPSLKVVLDLHRDGFELDTISREVAKKTVTSVVAGKKVAKILIIVTTDEFGLPHPNWQKNYNFARLLNETMNQMYPGLSRGIRIRNDGRFNQHVHEHALLLEIGAYESTEDEVMESARMLGDILAAVLEKMR